jgi:hypothetical protein
MGVDSSMVLRLTIREPAPYWPETGKAHTTRRGAGAGDVLFIVLRVSNTSNGEIAGITIRHFYDGHDGGYRSHRAVERLEGWRVLEKDVCCLQQVRRLACLQL